MSMDLSLNRPQRETRRPLRHEDMVALASTSSDDIDDHRSRGMSQPNLQAALSGLRTIITERDQLGGVDETERPLDGNYNTEQLNDGQAMGQLNDGNDDGHDVGRLNDGSDDGHDMGWLNDGNDDRHETRRLNDENNDADDDEHETRLMDDNNDNEHETVPTTIERDRHDAVDETKRQRLNDEQAMRRFDNGNHDTHETERLNDAEQPERTHGSPLGREARNEGMRALLNAVRDTNRSIETAFSRLKQEFRSFKNSCFEKFDRLDANLSSIRAVMEEQDSLEYPTKPACLPLKRIADLEAYENITQEEQSNVVKYLSNLGGTDANACANTMLKEALHERLAPKVNYYGRHEGTFRLEKTKFSKTLYQAMIKTLRMPTMPLTEFSAAITTALRAAKQRRRNSKQRRRNRVEPGAPDENGVDRNN